jgi:hypothetical protein
MKTNLKLYALLVIAIPVLATAQTSYDSDGDGIPDSTDQCLLAKGNSNLRGCPFPKHVTAVDRDGDGLKDVNDQCPDMFGLPENRGCPTLRKNISSDRTPSASNNSLFTTVSSAAGEKDEAFRQTLLQLAADTAKAFASASGGSEAKARTMTCLPGAVECYFMGAGTGKMYYADFGNYSDETAAANKYYELKLKLAQALGESSWANNENASGGYIDNVQFTKKKSGSRTPVITEHVQRQDNHYRVFITVEQKIK